MSKRYFVFLNLAICLLMFAQPTSAQTTTPCTATSLCLDNTYLVTGDYVLGGVGLQGLGDATGFATGTISIPDCTQATALGVACSTLPVVPNGADIVAAFLIWETVESTVPGSPTGQQGFFNGYPITGTILGNPKNPINWSNGGCTGNAQGSKTIRVYRADVRPFLPVNSNGNIQPNSSYTVQLKDSGSNGNTTPHTPGATLLIIYRVVSTIASMPLNAIVLYDGAAAPSNASSIFTQPIVGFYQADGSTAVKMTHIAGYGQTKKNELVQLNGTNLPTLYPAFPGDAFPGIYGGSWDTATWTANNSSINTIIQAGDFTVTSATVPALQNGECVDYAAIIFSTTVPDPNRDGLLPVWKAPPSGPPGYTDAKSGNFVALPGANPNAQDIFVEIDYLSNLDGSAGTYLHSHLPKQQALDMVGDAFAKQNVHVHFDVGTKYNGQTVCKVTPPAFTNQQTCPDPYIIQGGTGGNAISEGNFLCIDGTTAPLCQFPSTSASTPPVFEPTVSWKGGFLFLRDSPTLGNFQVGRGLSYRYTLSGHFLGEPRSSWYTGATALANPEFPALVSIVNSGTTATVTIQSPPGAFKPGDCPNPLVPACSDNNLDRVTVGGALGQPALNGVYQFTSLNSSTSTIDGVTVTTTTFNIATTNTTATCTTAPCVASGTYKFSPSCGANDVPPCAGEPQLAVAYGGPTLASGQSDFRGGADAAVALGWPEDDPLTSPPCQGDPSQPLQSGQAYCNNELGTVLQQAGTLLHETGHYLTLTHGGTFNIDPHNPFVPSYGLNCGSNKLSMMNYLFQVRGFLDNLAIVDYSGQTLPTLSETALNENNGLGLDLFTNKPAAHFTRWYAPPNALDTKLGRFVSRHCDGTPIGQNEPPAVRVDGSTITPLDWNNNLIVPDATEPVAWQDVNFSGSTSNSPDPPPSPVPPAFNDMQGFNDWINLDLRQTGARAGASGFSGTGSGFTPPATGGGGFTPPATGGGGFTPPVTGGGGFIPPATGSGGFTPPATGGGGTEQDRDTACSTADPPTGLTAALSSKSVVLNWNEGLEGDPSQPGGGLCPVRRYDVWRAQGNFPTPASVLANRGLFQDITLPNGITGTPPKTMFTDSSKLQNNTTYTYFVTETNAVGARSGASVPVTILVTFSSK